LMETCKSLEVCDPGGLAFLPTHYTYFFKCGLNNNGFKEMFKWKWVPNGDAVLQTAWGDEGKFVFAVANPPSWEFGPGVVSDGGAYLLSPTGDLSGTGMESELVFVDVNDGTEVKRFDLSDWYVDLNDAEKGGQAASGPAELSMWGRYVVMGTHSTCMNVLFDVQYEEEGDAVAWANSNGDYTGDHNFEADSAKPWVCNDYNVGPYKYNQAIEKNGFSFFPSFDMGAVSFGLYAPDGTGLGYQTLAGETAAQKYDTSVISGGTAYDGLLVSNQSAAEAEERGGWFWVGQDSFKGIISSEPVSVDEAPAAFAVAQNSPNPFNPSTTINFTVPEAGNVSVDVYNVAGQKIDTISNEFMGAGSHSVVWDASGFSAGVYFYTVKSGSFSRTMKMTLLK
ncbi:T9SS type A sorting domain-containing protein, partial [bacterium]|nr:T9SS type A sorting domain-containing protein [bacterium]